jgi:hypothetical protein
VPPSPDILKELDQLREELTRARGKVVLRLGYRRRGDSVRATADALVVEAGGSPPGDQWVDLSREAAEQVVVALLFRDLAYGIPGGLGLGAADRLASRILAVLPDTSLFVINGEFGLSHAGLSSNTQWQPLTTSTFDAGIVGVADDIALVFWVADED